LRLIRFRARNVRDHPAAPGTSGIILPLTRQRPALIMRRLSCGACADFRRVVSLQLIILMIDLLTDIVRRAQYIAMI
jgi:hypothetical protein